MPHGNTLKTRYRVRSVGKLEINYSFNRTMSNVDGYEALFHAICKQASYDIVKCNRYQQTAVMFYTGDWFSSLTGLNGQAIVNRLRKFN